MVRSGGDSLATALGAAIANANLLICDAISNDDLARIASAASHALPNALLCGSAGLMGALAAQERLIPDRLVVHHLPTCEHAIVVIGSGSKLAHQQLQQLQRRYAAHVATICVDSKPAENEGSLKHLVDHAAPPIIVIHQQAPEAGIPLDGPLARSRAAILAEQAERNIIHTRPDLLILVGGDTAISVLRRLAVERLVMLRELLPGVPLARAITADRQEILVVLKAGSFGDPQTLVELLGMCLRPLS
jgi:4-hydroxythreonine-4-phosphate dehydrogenase